MNEPSLPLEQGLDRWWQRLVLLVVLATILLIPLKVCSLGYIPIDDALFFAAKAITGKPLQEIVIVKPGFNPDFLHDGWNVILRQLHLRFGLGADDLLMFSIVFAFAAFCLAPLPFLTHPEAWCLTLFLVMVMGKGNILAWRLLLGRPFAVGMGVFVVLCFFWRTFQERRATIAGWFTLVIVVALASWIHSPLYFYVPLIGFFFTGAIRDACRLSAAVVGGSILGVCLTGSPLAYFTDVVKIFSQVSHTDAVAMNIAREWRPFAGDDPILFIVVAMLLWRKVRGAWDPATLRQPAFLIGIGGWLLGFHMVRYWVDLGIPAFCAWLTMEFEAVFTTADWQRQRDRWLVVPLVCAGLFLAASADLDGRWTARSRDLFLTREDPLHAAWLPPPGGIIYNPSMKVFTDTFFANPTAEWRYIFGLEPTLMPDDDLEILTRILWNRDQPEFPEYFRPWIRKMRPADRFIVNNLVLDGLQLGLEWQHLGNRMSVGRLPVAKTE